MQGDDLFEAIPIPILQIRADRIIAAANKPAAELFAIRLEGRHFATILRKPSVVEGVGAVLDGAGPRRVRLQLLKDGRNRLFEVTVSPASSAGAVLAFEDVTQARQSDQMRADFVANVSHELRTPLTAMTGLIETLRGPARDDAAARERFLEMMLREAGRMNRLVSDLLSLSRVEDTERELPTGEVDLCREIEAAVTSLNPNDDEGKVRLEIIGCDAPVLVPGDADQLRQVFNNLVENALKYGASGGRVQITLTREAHQPLLQGPGVRVDVRDWGEGISQRHIGRLTERFYRADDHRGRETGGTGLGLAIVKHILNRHRGRLRIESARGKGSCFSVFLPGE